jgi:hypothetical protein
MTQTRYAGYMQGIVALERELWEAALTHLAKASTVSYIEIIHDI